MKKKIAVLLSFILLFSAAALALADDPDEVPGTVESPYGGFTFVPPEAVRKTRGVFLFDGTGLLTDYAFYSTWFYVAAPEEEIAGISYGDPRLMPLFFVLSVRGGKTIDDVNADYYNYFRTENAREIAKEGDTTFYLYMEPPYEEFLSAVSGTEYEAEYTALAAMADEFAAAFTFRQPEDLPEESGGAASGDPDDAAYEALIGTKVEFTTTDLDGNSVSSADLFAQNEITMVNIWATWCGPCVNELPELQEISLRLKDQNCGVIGLLVDGDVETAKLLMEDNGVTYPVILAPENLDEMFIHYYVPDTYFVDSEGMILAVPVVGAYTDRYEPAVEELLQK